MPPTVSTGLAITNPLVKYRALVSTKQIQQDQGQLRLALHLQRLYDRLIDYEPQQEYSHRLDQISRAVRKQQPSNGSAKSTDEVVPQPPKQSTWRSFLAAKEKRDSLALTRRLTSQESAMEMSSPRGLMLHGEVGTGKSMLIDLFADCLPTRKKRRWHFNTFMLETFSKLEAFRRHKLLQDQDNGDDYSVLWMAKDLIQTSPILFLDEFQMPDRVASKILTNLMTSFFQLGGVLIATSNRMPEELAKASGIEFSPPPSRMESLGWQFGFRRKVQSPYAGRNECEVWEMGGGKDYRRLESTSAAAPPTQKGEEDVQWRMDEYLDLQHSAGMAGWPHAEGEQPAEKEDTTSSAAAMPRFFFVDSGDDAAQQQAYNSVLEAASGTSTDTIKLEPSTMRVYGRTIPIPRTYKGITEWTFAEICKTTLGPADYTTLASTYHTLILKDVPVLTWLMKNEARRLITLLDALYECKCKLFVIAEAGPDDIFFPEQSLSGEESDAIQSETFSEAYQDATAPFRPNILSDNPNYAEPDPEPNYTHARLAGLLSADALEDDPPNRPAQQGKNAFGRSFGRTDSEMERKPIDPDDQPRYRSPDFGKASAFTGEDERFAYKRAQSRLWEMCGAKWWARNEEGWHRPLPAEVRRWERAVGEDAPSSPGEGQSDVSVGEAAVDETRDESMFKRGGSPFRTSEEPPPKFSWVHAWGTMQWGKKAGAWGRGPEGLKDRGDEKR
ncbi:uncharacterized protein LTR77_004498 [Saxophila tyrrhenica]|uniref:AAA+ ATPase domain-containing protein n=1 Tax=Saxophila tyrrhenica TaxID=1690608 RepID=A0AAV9PFH3_9PEZI|nr:hypothetical protein LTR77_004498 [Saxophila tyrrhenica]